MFRFRIPCVVSSAFLLLFCDLSLFASELAYADMFDSGWHRSTSVAKPAVDNTDWGLILFVGAIALLCLIGAVVGLLLVVKQSDKHKAREQEMLQVARTQRMGTDVSQYPPAPQQAQEPMLEIAQPPVPPASSPGSPDQEARS